MRTIRATAEDKVEPAVRAQLAKASRATVMVVFRDPGTSPFQPPNHTPQFSHRATHVRSAESYDAWRQAHVKKVTAAKDAVFSSLPPGQVTVVKDWAPFLVAMVSTTQGGLEALLSHPDVVRVHLPRTYTADLDESLPIIGADTVHSLGAEYQGTGTAVAVLDTGCDYTRAAFGSCSAPGGSCKVAYAHDFTSPDDGSLDDDLHGTNVAGIVLGVAPETKILALDVFQQQPSGANTAAEDDINDALTWVFNNKATYNIVAANLSIGDHVHHPSYCPDAGEAVKLKAVYQAGIIPVISAGNDGFADGLDSPSCVPWAMSVANTYDHAGTSHSWTACTEGAYSVDTVACSSNSSRQLALAAPGADITAAGLVGGGTSQAAPHVAGAIAVARGNSWAKTLTPAALWTLLRIEADWTTDSKSQGGQGLPVPRLNLLGLWSKNVPWNALNGYDHRNYATPPAISDGNGCSSLSSPIGFSGVAGQVDKVYALIDVDHAAVDQLEVTLEAPDGATVPLHVRRQLGTSHNLNPVYGVAHPADLDRFHGKTVSGTWTIRIRDMVAGTQGTLWGTALVIKTCTTCASYVCGDGTCSTGESSMTCPSDCVGGSCGDGACSTLESCASCPSDCGSCTYCGDGTCQPSNESCSSCSDDCGACQDLCASCTSFTECAGGHCVHFGSSSAYFCSQDCSSTPCPTGYTCYTPENVCGPTGGDICSQCSPTCCPLCMGKQCGPDGCGDTCGTCTAPLVCNTAGQCVLPLGAACSAGAQCGSGYCVDGVCCNGTCGGGASDDCQACSIAAGASSNGYCAALATGTICRAASGVCDLAESCNGLSGSCPADAVRPTTAVCRAASGTCDVAESCTGTSKACPADGVASSGTVCRAKAGDCDVAESCTGTSKACPADGVASSGTVCRAKAGDCDVAESCNGVGKNCPVNVLVVAGTMGCRSFEPTPNGRDIGVLTRDLG